VESPRISSAQITTASAARVFIPGPAAGAEMEWVMPSAPQLSAPPAVHPKPQFLKAHAVGHGEVLFNISQIATIEMRRVRTAEDKLEQWATIWIGGRKFEVTQTFDVVYEAIRDAAGPVLDVVLDRPYLDAGENADVD
jgi:hypothetical protein